ncbi:hypothetical protein MASR2M17_07080 [Aminivibrio sp.]
MTDMVRDIENGLALIENGFGTKTPKSGIWEEIYNPGLFPIRGIKNQLVAFVLSVKQWVERPARLGSSQSGRYGGTYAHKDIALICLVDTLLNLNST